MVKMKCICTQSDNSKPKSFYFSTSKLRYFYKKLSYLLQTVGPTSVNLFSKHITFQ